MQFTTSLLVLAAALPAAFGNYQLTAWTDYGCTENQVSMGGPLPGNNECTDLGIEAKCITWDFNAGMSERMHITKVGQAADSIASDGKLDGWVPSRGGCLSGECSEDAQVSQDGSLENSA